MRLQAALTEYRYAKDLTPKSQRWYDSKLAAFADFCAAQDVVNVEDITAPLVRRYIVHLRETPSPRYGTLISSHTLHGSVRAVKCFLNWTVREDLLSEKVPRHIEMPRRDQKVLQTFTPQHIELLFRACDQSETPDYVARDRAILAVLLDTGLRANELCTVTLDRTILTADDAYLLVNGKGRKQREVGLGKRSRQLLHRYIHRHRDAPRDQPYVFLAKGGTPLTPEGLDRLLYRLRDRVGAERFGGVRVSAHTFRHTFACEYLTQGGDLYKLSRLMGHTSVVITEGYLRAFSARDARKGRSVFDQM